MSARKSLRDRLEQARRENYIDLRVTTPAFDGLFVRCRALLPAQVDEALERNAKKTDAGIQMAVDTVVATCVGIWEEDGDKGVSPVDGFSGVIDLDTGNLSGDLPTFSSPELAEALGLSEQSAEANVMALLAPHTPLRVLAYSEALQEFSMGANHTLVREARGN